MRNLTKLRAKLRPVKLSAILALENREIGFRLSMRIRGAAKVPKGRPSAPWHNAVLKSSDEVAATLAQVKHLGLPLMNDLCKNWDSLAALDIVLANTHCGARIFDAGAETYSMILPWLYLYGYRDLIAGNLVFKRPFNRGPIRYQFANIANSGFESGSYDAITCLSVIEHGVDLEAYFREMARLLKPNGILVTSTDYFEGPTNTHGQIAYGCPIRVFTREDIDQIVMLAKRFGLELTGPLDLTSHDRVVHWNEFSLSYTFVVFSMRKRIESQ